MIKTYVLIVILNIPTQGVYLRPVAIQQEFNSLTQCNYVLQTLIKQADFKAGGCFEK